MSPGCGSESCLQHLKLKSAGKKKAKIFFHQGCFSIFFLSLQVWELFIFNHFKRTSGSQTSAARVSLCSASQQSAEIKTLKTRLSENDCRKSTSRCSFKIRSKNQCVNIRVCVCLFLSFFPLEVMIWSAWTWWKPEKPPRVTSGKIKVYETC